MIVAGTTQQRRRQTTTRGVDVDDVTPRCVRHRRRARGDRDLTARLCERDVGAPHSAGLATVLCIDRRPARQWGRDLPLDNAPSLLRDTFTSSVSDADCASRRMAAPR